MAQLAEIEAALDADDDDAEPIDPREIVRLSDQAKVVEAERTRPKKRKRRRKPAEPSAAEPAAKRPLKSVLCLAMAQPR